MLPTMGNAPNMNNFQAPQNQMVNGQQQMGPGMMNGGN